ncbi:MAG: oligosaccharide flippase family protein [Candidatus Woesearchaeota archaeon]
MFNKIKSLASDTLIYGLFMIIGRFLTFLLTPLYTNYLTQQEVGEVNYIFSMIAFINIIYSFGMEATFFRFYSKSDFIQTKKVYTHTFLSIALVGFTISACIFIASDYISAYLIDLPNSSEVLRLAVVIPFLDGLMIVPYALLRMERAVKKFSIIRLSLILITVASNIFFVVLLKWRVEGVFIANIIASAIGVGVFSTSIVKYLYFKFDYKLYKQMLRFGVPTVPANLSAMILQVADRPILKFLTNSEVVALYSVNHRLGLPMMIFVSVFEYAWKPFYLSHYEDDDAKELFARVLTYFTLAGAIIFLSFGFFNDYIVRLPFIGGKFINEAYWHGLVIVPIILAGYFFNGVFINFAAGFHITKRTEFFPIAVGSSALINIILNFALVPFISYWGSAIAFLLAYITSAGILLYFSFKIYPIKYEVRRLIIILVTTLVVFFTTMYISTGINLWFAFLIRFLAIIAFIFLLWVFKFFKRSELDRVKKLFFKKSVKFDI